MKKPKKDGHKPSRQVRIREVYLPCLDNLAKRRGTSAPQEVNRAVMELLQREGLWPPEECTETDVQ